jgi:hypothetical protein
MHSQELILVGPVFIAEKIKRIFPGVLYCEEIAFGSIQIGIMRVFFVISPSSVTPIGVSYVAQLAS